MNSKDFGNLRVAQENADGSGAGALVENRVTGAGIEVALLTGGDDRTYAHALTHALIDAGVVLDFIGSDSLDAPELHCDPRLRFLNLRGDQSENSPFSVKARRILRYYIRLLAYAATARPRILHILWNNKFEYFDRTFLMAYYRILGRKVVLTAHNVNARARDMRDSVLNRWTLWVQYRLCEHIFVHTQKMKVQLQSEFGVPEWRISVIPFGINDVTPRTAMIRAGARKRLGVNDSDRVLLCFGQIAPYKGLEYALTAFGSLVQEDARLKLIIAGKVKKGFEAYWNGVCSLLDSESLRGRVLLRIEHIPDEDVEIYFKAADALLLPYTQIFQSGVPFLGFSFGLPVVATDVGELRDDVIDGETGFLSRPRDSMDLARAVRTYFESDLYHCLDERRSRIRERALADHSWTSVAKLTVGAYRSVLTAGSRG